MKQASRGEGEVILLVDDHPQIIEIGSKLLESLGYQVMTATNGQKAVELFEAHVNEIDLVILDVVMPVMSGDKAAQCIRKIKSNARVIFATGYDKNMLKGMKDEDVISKPFRINDMSELVKRKLGS
ncbi:response regulator [Mariprofundus sp. EBB-1]|uniref:response regulator n=1 Tax=Mariprofundus sp. EBB-1 TaxID=2650971 RepID=UPI000EF1789F|nr:response regulator [Mariprofundus sp. EBB-1]RLL48951.1 response regulator [Mariprofundus sp. EBB-1]